MALIIMDFLPSMFQKLVQAIGGLMSTITLVLTVRLGITVARKLAYGTTINVTCGVFVVCKTETKRIPLCSCSAGLFEEVFFNIG